MIRLILALLLLSYSGNLWAADADRGEVIAKVRCTPCHHLHMTTKLIGPGLKGVYGRVPTIKQVPFAHWDAQALDTWLTNPRAIKPNTKMSIPPIAARDRADLIAYFKRDAERLQAQTKR